MRFIFAAVILLLAAAGLAEAEVGLAENSEGDRWETRVWDRTITFRGSGREDINYKMYSLHTTSADKPGLMFSCSDEYGLNVLYSFEGVDFIDLFQSHRASHLRSIPVHLWVGSHGFELAGYFVRRKDHVIANQTETQAAIAMGALLQDLPIRIKASGYFDETLDLPPLDEEVMRFINVCDKAAELAKTVREAEAARAD